MRRRFVATLAGWAAAGLGLGGTATWPRAARAGGGVGPAAVFSRPGSARRVGLALRGAGVDVAPDFDRAFAAAVAAAPSPAALRRRLAAAVRADFAAGRTVRVGGWTLARTEAQLCLLVARERPDAPVERR